MAPRQVVAAVIVRGELILVARRRSGVHAGKWEFPGGKVEPGETPQAALVREIDEEFGVTIAVGERIGAVPFTVGSVDYLLVAHYAVHLAGDYRPVDHHAIKWVRAEELPSLDLAPADIPIAGAVSGTGGAGREEQRTTAQQKQVRR